MKRTSKRQGRSREGRSEGSRRQNHGAMNKNAIEGPVSGVSQHHITKPVDSGHTVNGALAGWKLMLLSGETSFRCVRDPGARRRAIVGVMGPIFEPVFSDHSYGFRPGRNAHQAVERIREAIKQEYRIAVDLDLAKFF